MRKLTSHIATATGVAVFIAATLGLAGVAIFIPSLLTLQPDWNALQTSLALAGPAGIWWTATTFTRTHTN